MDEWMNINVSAVQWESAIDAALEANDLPSIAEGADNAWSDNLDHDDPIRANICNLTGILDPDLFSQAVEENLRDSNSRMYHGSKPSGS